MPEEKRGTGDLMLKKLFVARDSPSATFPLIRVQTRSNPVFFPDRVLRPLRPAGYAFDAADEVPVDKLQYSISSSKHVNAPIVSVDFETCKNYHLSSISQCGISPPVLERDTSECQYRCSIPVSGHTRHAERGLRLLRKIYIARL